MPIENLPGDGHTQKPASESGDFPNRREIAQKTGKFLAYTAPALIALITSQDADAGY